METLAGEKNVKRYNRTLARVVFIPISIRFNCSQAGVVFPTLAARLAEVYGEPVKRVDMGAEQWRGLCLDFLSHAPPTGRPLVVILDGLDEATDWHADRSLFPAKPPSGLRVVASARQLSGDKNDEGWRERLGWMSPSLAQTEHLHALTREGLRQVLQAMGESARELVARDDIVAQLFRLSGGDPILVRLYVEALAITAGRSVMLRPEDLPSIKPGLDGFFGRWWNDQQELWEAQHRSGYRLREAEIQDFLRVCAVAMGPLTRDEVAEIVGGPLVSGLNIESIAKEVGRFITGDGKGNGYVFSHPRFAQFVVENMTAKEWDAWERRFLEFGSRTSANLNANTAPIKAISRYVLLHYGAHLERAKAPDKDVFALISENWLNAWHEVDGTYAGFLSDVERAWRLAEATYDARRNAGSIMVQLRSALCQSSVTALSTNIPPVLIGRAVKHRMITGAQALVLVRQIRYDHQKAEALAIVSPLLTRPLLEQALETARAIEDRSFRTAALVGIGRHFSGSEQDKILSEALQEARSVPNVHARIKATCLLTSYVPEEIWEHDFRELITTWKHTGRSWDVAESLELLAPQMPQEYISEAQGLARTVGSVSAVLAIGLRLPHQVQHAAVREVMDLLRKSANQGSEKWGWELVTLVPRLPDSVLSEALEIARSMKSPWHRAQSLARLVPRLPETQREAPLNDLLAAADEFRHVKDRTRLLLAVAPYLPLSLLRDLLEDVYQMGQDTFRVEWLGRIAECLPAEEQVGIWREALKTVRAIGDAQSRSVTLGQLASKLPQSLLREALDATNWIGDVAERMTLLMPLVRKLSNPLRSNITQELLETTRGVGAADERTRLLSDLVPLLPKELRTKTSLEALTSLREAIKVGRTTPPGTGVSWYPPDELGRLVKVLPLSSRYKAIDVALSIEDPYERLKALTAISPALPHTLRGGVVTTVLSAVSGLQDPNHQISVLKSLMPSLGKLQRENALAGIVNALKELLGPNWPHPPSGEVGSELKAIVPYLDKSELPRVFDIVSGIQEDWQRASMLQALIPRLSKKLTYQGINVASTVESEGARTASIEAFILHGSRNQWRKYGEVSRKVVGADNRAKLLLALALRVPSELRMTLLMEVLATMRLIENEDALLGLIRKVLPYLSAKMLREVLAIAHGIKTSYSRAYAMIVLAPKFRGMEREKALQDALHAIAEIEREDLRSFALLDLAAVVRGEMLENVLHQALEIARTRPGTFLIERFCALVPQLPKEQRDIVASEILELIKRIPPESGLPGGALTPPSWDRIRVLSSMVPYVSEGLKDVLLRDALQTLQKIDQVTWTILQSLRPFFNAWFREQPHAGYAIWKTALRSSSKLPRPQLLENLVFLITFRAGMGQGTYSNRNLEDSS
jgi:hypothetical protein